jgi:PAS domain S-box-containing protein
MKQSPSIDQGIDTSIRQILKEEYFGESYILNLLPYAVYVCDVSGKIIHYNRKAVELWGRTPKKGHKDELYCGSLKLYYPDGTYLPHNETPVAGCLTDGLPRENMEVVIERPDHSTITVRVNIVPIKDESKNVLGMINCFYDISEEKKTQKELNWKTKQLQDYVDNAAIGLHWVDGNGIIKWANKAELEMLGYSEQEYIGHHISEFHVEEEKISDILKRLSCNETLNSYESNLRCKDGSIKTVQISSNVFWDEGNFIHTRCFTVDVTAQKKLFQSLKKSEESYRRLVRTLPTGVYTCDKEGHFTFYNDMATQLWGCVPELNDNSYRFCGWHKVMDLQGNVIPPDQTPMALALQSNRSFRNIEAIAERENGERVYICVNIDSILDDAGNVIGAINVFQDITTLKQTEIALRKSEAKYRNLIHTLQTPLYTTDAEGRITMYNKAAADLWGREPEVGKDLWCGSYKIFTTDGGNLPLEECPMAVCLKEQRPVYGEEILVVRPDGSLRNVAPHPQPLFDESGKMIGAINMLIDVTDIKKTEHALRESEKRYRELAASLEKKVEEKTQDLKFKNEELKSSEERYHKMVEEVEDYAIILLDKEGIVRNWNKGAEKIKGYKEEEIVGKSFSAFYLPEDRENGLPQRILDEAREKGKALYEGWRMKKDGSQFWGSIVLTALHDDENRIIGFSKVTRDLTERKLAEDKMKEYTSQLEFQNNELEQFAYAASHDMKEPLRKIHLYSSAIAENPNNTLDEKSKEFLSRSINATKRMTELIEDLLTYSKATANTDNFEMVDLNEVIDEIMLLHKDEFEQKKVQTQIERLPIINAVPFQMTQLFTNIISNSIKYKHPERSVFVQIKTEEIKGFQIQDSSAEPSRIYHKITVTDNGIGFAQQNVERIFNIFQRLHNRSSSEGSGIGLAICKRIVQNHYGYIKAIGVENQGASFEIYLPK